MKWAHIVKVLYKCPVKSIYQYKSSVFPQWWNFSGYGAQGHGESIEGLWDYVFTFAEIDGTEIADHVNKEGLILYRGKKLEDKRFACLYDQEYLVYKRVL